MTTTRAIDDLVETLVGDILKILERTRAEHRARALDTVAALLAETPRPAPVRAPSARATAPLAQKAAPAPKAAKPARKPAAAPARKPTAAPAPAPVREARTSAPPSARRASEPPKRARPRVKPLDRPVGPAAAAAAPATEQTESASSASERETTVLEAVRTLVRATAGEVADRCGLPNGTAYVVLRALCASRRVAKTETARGIEYSLVSPGGIQPFKRAKATPPAEATPPAPATNVA